MYLTLTSPRTLFDDFDSALSDLLPSGSYFGNRSAKIYTSKDGNKYSIKVKAPGFKKNEISISASNGVLTISGKRKTKDETEWLEEDFEEKVKLPTDVDADSISAQLTDGILAVSVPVAERAKPKLIEVK